MLTESMNDLITYVRETVNLLSGSQTEVTAEPDDEGIVLHVKVHGNVPAVIGRNGKTIDAIRVITKAIGYKADGKTMHRIKVVVNART